MSRQLKLLIGIIAAVVATTASRADTIAYNTSLAAGYYNGTGNPNTGFTTDTTIDGIQLGLGVNLRFVGPVLPTSTNNYNVPTGTSAHSPAGSATWDFEYSVDFGSSGLFNIGNTDALLTILNVGTGLSASFDPAAISDDATNGNGYQNAENLGFSFIGSAIGFDPNAPDQYIITLSLSSAIGSPLASVTENIDATPIPATLPLFVGGLGLFGYLARRRKMSCKRALAAA
jgi:hypothetical protein